MEIVLTSNLVSLETEKTVTLMEKLLKTLKSKRTNNELKEKFLFSSKMHYLLEIT